MANKTRGGKNLAAPAQKYAGQVRIGGGPVPIERWHRPYTRDEHDRGLGAEGVDLHPERPEHQKSPPPNTQTGGNFNRQGRRS